LKEIELSTMVAGDSLDLPAFEAQTFITARHRQFDWAAGWTNILQIALYQKGPDLSEIGSTWLENLNDMRALRPFTASELNSLGGDIAFLSNAWEQEVTTPAAVAAPRRVTSIPWILDTRLIYYRKDLLAQAGIPEEEAFATPEAMYATLRALQNRGMAFPLGLATGGLSIHNLACWVWGRGGHFRSRDYRKIALVEPEARHGMADYFRLLRFLDPASRGADYTAINDRFARGEIAVMLNGQWLMQDIKNRRAGLCPEVLENTGYAMPPGVPFVGAAHLVVWRHSLYEQEAIQLISHLTSLPVLARVFQATGNFPARLAALNAAPFAGDPDYQLVGECIRRGRMMRSAHLWAGVEMRLNALCDQLWEDLFANPNLNLEHEIEVRIKDLAGRLEKTLLANW
jgi:multiple sugar transport system substrate-binding protein